jgi:hypothetical protein
MKVICIDDTHWRIDTPCPKFGETVTVSNELKSPVSGEPCFEFVEYPRLPGHAFRIFSKKYFAPLSGLDETELVTEEFEEKYCVPVNQEV